jgi:hypothetical protein
MKNDLKFMAMVFVIAIALLAGIISCTKNMNGPELQASPPIIQQSAIPAQINTSLIAKDHLSVMNCLLANLYTLKKAGLITKASSSTQILNAIGSLRTIDAATKEKIKVAVANYNIIARQKIPAAKLALINEVKQRTSVLKVKTASDFKALILSVRNDSRYKSYPDILAGLNVAAQFVTDGEKTIYSVSYYKTIAGLSVKDDYRLNQVAKEILEEDKDGAIDGAVAGAVAGAATGPLEAGTIVGGAVAGGITGSVAAAVSNFLDWLFE